MAKITIAKDTTGKVVYVFGKMSGLIRDLKALGFKETNDEGEDVVHTKTFEPTDNVSWVKVFNLCARKDIRPKIITV
jgi:hypothetical protein